MECFFENESGILRGRITPEENHLYAFYVHRNNELIHIRGYSPDNELCFDTNGERGLYYLSCFTMDAERNRLMTRTGFRLVHGPLIPLESLDKSALTAADFFPFYVRAGEHNFHCLFSGGKTDRLFVLLTAAISRKAGITSHFNRVNLRSTFDGHCLYISDPTLETFPELDLGWYLGNEERYATRDMADLVAKIAATLGIGNERVATYGSSGGGFAAMALANLLPGATGVAINPQTRALNYIPSSVQSVLTHCYGGKTREEVLRLYPERVDLTIALRSTPSKMIIAQNTLDHYHWKPHYLPLAEVLGLPASSGPSVDGRHHSVIFEDERGHSYETPEVLREILHLLDDRKGEANG